MRYRANIFFVCSSGLARRSPLYDPLGSIYNKKPSKAKASEGEVGTTRFELATLPPQAGCATGLIFFLFVRRALPDVAHYMIP